MKENSPRFYARHSAGGNEVSAEMRCAAVEAVEKRADFYDKMEHRRRLRTLLKTFLDLLVLMAILAGVWYGWTEWDKSRKRHEREMANE